MPNTAVVMIPALFVIGYVVSAWVSKRSRGQVCAYCHAPILPGGHFCSRCGSSTMTMS